MTDLVVIVPSRGRSHAAGQLVDAFASTCTADVHLVFVLDERDVAQIYDYPHVDVANVRTNTVWTESTTMVEALNRAAAAVVAGDPSYGFESEPPFAVGFMGDDHAPRTVGWDRQYLDALREFGTGIVYGDDLLQGEKLPTQCAMTADIVRALGYMAPPVLTHMYVDNFWLDLGRAVGCIRYLPDVVVEHVHPVAGKAEWDEGHRRVNAPSMYETDRTAYARFRADGSMAAAVAKVKALR